MKRLAVWAILLALPSAVLAQNLLLDPTFSDPVALTCAKEDRNSPWNSAVWIPWASSGGYKCIRNSDTHIPSCPRDPAGDNDSMRGSISWGEPYAHRFYQTVNVTPGVAYSLTGWWAGGNNSVDVPIQIKIQLVDGAGYSGTVLNEYGGTVPAAQSRDWTSFAINGTPTQAQMTVVVYGAPLGNHWQAKTIHVDDLELTVAPCPTAPTIDAPVSPATNPTPDHAARDTTVNVQINGTNFEEGKMTVKLRKETTTITATNVVFSSSTSITCDFDLTGAALGYWDLVVEKALCPPEAVLLNAFRVVLPGPSLHNGSFELPTAPGGCPVTPQGTPSDWTFVEGDFYGGSFGYRDEDAVLPPSCPPPDGDHYLSTKSRRGGGVTAATQTVTCTPGTTYTFTGMFAGGGGNVVRIALLDGGPDDVVLNETMIYNGGLDATPYDWTFAYVAGAPTGDIITVRWEIGNTGPGEVDRAAHADNLVLTPCTGSVSVSAVTPPVAAAGEVLTGVTITGTGFSGGPPVVYLSRTGKSIPGTNVSVANDTSLTCDFDLTGATTGTYDVIVGNNGCFASLAGAMMVASPVLVNPEFEYPTADQNCGPPPTIVLGVPTGWSTNAPDEFVRDGNVFYPGACPCPDSAGGHYGTMSTGFGAELRAWQTLKVMTGRTYRFAGWFAGGGTNTVTIKLVDGSDPTATPLASTTVSSPGEASTTWKYSSVQANAASDILTVVWELTGAAGDSATHADGFTFETPCNDPFADADADGDVDQTDFAVFQLCYTGSGQGPVPTTPEYCKCLDVDGAGGQPDNDIDQGDFNKFEACASGPGILASTACDD